MSYLISRSEVERLFEMRRPSEVEEFLQILTRRNNWDWCPLGDRPANAANVETTEEPGPGIIERIVNGIDAMLELSYISRGGQEPPTSPRLAAERYFGLAGGTLAFLNEDRTLLNSLAPNLRVEAYDAGIRKTLSVSVLDKGIGQHPDDLPTTILSLGASNKISKHYVCGAYGQGGSATFAWCPYSIIISRRKRELANGKPDLVGWTIIRKHDDVSLKQNTYQYLVTDEKRIPTFSPDLLDQPRFEFGTYIMHIAYQAARLVADWSLVGYRYFNNYLFDPVLPYTMRDNREPRPQDRYMYGTLGRLTGANVIYRREEDVPLGGDGTIKVRYWVFQPRQDQEESNGPDAAKLDSYLETAGSNRTVVITLNGQKHAYLTNSFVKKTSRLSLVADSLLVQVDCDQLSQLRKKEMFTSNRSGVRSGEGRMELIETAITQALDDPELRRINARLIQDHISRVDVEEEKKILKILQKLIDITKPEETVGTAPTQGGDQSGTGVGRFRPHDPPTYFEFADLRRPLQLEPAISTRIDIKTDGPNDMFTRERRRAVLSLEIVGSEGISMNRGRLNNGRLQIVIAASRTVPPGNRCTLRAALQMEGGTYIVTERPCIVVPPPPPYLGVDPPTFLRFAAKGDRIQLKKGLTSRILLRSDCQNDFLSRSEKPGQFHFECSLAGINLVGCKHPYGGEIELKISVDESLDINREGSLVVRFTTSEGIILEDVKMCTIVEAPPEEKRPGRQQARTGNIKLIKVWREAPPDDPMAMTWNSQGLDWNAENVGKYAIDKDPEGNDLLLLYINMDHSELEKERRRRLQLYGTTRVSAFERRYAAYIGYHLWLCCEQAEGLISRAPSAEQDIPEQHEEERKPETQEQELTMEKEMKRVAKTIIQALRSESDLRTEEPGSDQEY